MQVTRLRVYPVKSFAGSDVDSASVMAWGLRDDRRWAVIEPGGEPITAREANGLLSLTATVLPDGGLLLGTRGGSDAVRVAVPADAAPIPVGHSRQGSARPAGPAADTWLSAQLGRPAHLVWQPDPRDRPVNPKHGGRPGDHVSLADVAPLLLTTESSLSQLDRWTDDETPPLDMLRFRPNIVVDGDPDEPFAEDDWPFVQIGGTRFRVNGVCDRCVMTTIDPFSLERGKEPIRTLAKHRRWNGSTWFGIWLVPELDASAPAPAISVGDAVIPGGADAPHLG